MATRGCTSRAASRDPHVLRVPWTVILGTCAFLMQRSKLRLKFRGSTAADHVDLEGNPDADPPVPPHVDVWRVPASG